MLGRRTFLVGGAALTGLVAAGAFGVGHQTDLDGVAVRVDCGAGDPFYRDVQDYVDAFPDDAGVVSTFEPGAHDAAYWRRMLPAQLEFLGRGVGSTP